MKAEFTFTRSDRLRCLLLALASPLVLLLALITPGLGDFLFAQGDNGQSPGLLAKIDNSVEQTVLYKRQNTSPSVNAATEKIAVVAIDEETLANEKYHEWPIPRTRYAELIDALEAGGAKAIGLDILFLEHQKSYPGADEALARALHRYQNVVIAGTVERMRDGTIGFQDPVSTLTDGWSEADKVKHVGIAMEPEVAGVIKRVPLVINIGKATRYSFDTLLACAVRGVPLDRVQDNSDRGTVNIGDLQVPTARGEMLIQYFWGGSLAGNKSRAEEVLNLNEGGLSMQMKVSYYPLSAVSEMNADDRRFYFQDRLVLVGVTAQAGHDVKNTPLGPMAGIDVHANILAGLLGGEFLHPLGRAPFLAIMLGGVLLLGLVLPRLNPYLAGGLFVPMMYVVAYQLPTWMLMSHRIEFNPGLTLAALAVAFTSIMIYLYGLEKRRREKISSLIKEIAPLPDSFIEQYLVQGDMKLGGQDQVVSILFSDIRGYTTMSEKMAAGDVMTVLNELYTEMGNILHKHGGGIFDYIGDAQMVVFGLDEKSLPNHGEAALQASIEMIERMEVLNEKWIRERNCPVEIGIGISTGSVSLGLMGSGQRKQYSAIGDTTNVAARLQALSSELKAPIIISVATCEMLKGTYPMEKVEGVKVKGKTEVLTVYRVLAGKPAKSAKEQVSAI